MLAAGSTKSQRWSYSNVVEEHNAPFQSSKPFFSSSEKPPLSPHLLCQELLRLFSQLGGWKSDRGETGRRGKKGWGWGEDWGIVSWISVTEALLIASLWFCGSGLEIRWQELCGVTSGYKSRVKCAKQSCKIKQSLITGNGQKIPNGERSRLQFVFHSLGKIE